MKRSALMTFLACTALLAGTAAAQLEDPRVPRALLALERMGTPSGILRDSIIAAAAVTAIELGIDSAAQVRIQTRGQPPVRIREPIYLPDRIRLRAEIRACPDSALILPQPGTGVIMRLQLNSDTVASITVLFIDVLPGTRVLVDQAPDLTTIHLSEPPLPAAAHQADAQSAFRGAIRWLARSVEWPAYAWPIGVGATLLFLVSILALGIRRRRGGRDLRSAPDLWVVHTLAAAGGSAADIAARTRLPREAVMLLLHRPLAARHAAKPAVRGRNFPSPARQRRMPVRALG